MKDVSCVLDRVAPETQRKVAGKDHTPNHIHDDPMHPLSFPIDRLVVSLAALSPPLRPLAEACASRGTYSSHKVGV